MTNAERKSLKKVLAYLGDEKADYEASVEAGESVGRHIYRDVQVLETYLKNQQPPKRKGARRTVK